MRIALTVEGTRGDVHPLLALGTALAAAGHRIRVCAPPDFQAAVLDHGFDFHPVGQPVQAYLREHAAVFNAGPWSIARQSRRYIVDAIAAQFAELPAALADADLVVAAGLSFAAASVAERLDRPYRYVAYCPVLMPSAEHPPLPFTRQRYPRWLNRALWGVALRVQEHVVRPLIDNGRRDLGLPRLDDAFRHLLGELPLLACDAELAPVPADLPFPVLQVPCLHPAEPGAAGLPAKLEGFLANGPAPVYLGFGSMPDAEPTRTTRTVLAAIEAAGCRALISAGWAGLGEGPLPEGVMTLGSVDHAALFPRVAGVVHHGGAGTTTTAARAGAPQLVVPHLLDQFYWAERVGRLGLGPPGIARGKLSAEPLSVALRELAENELLAERAREIGGRLRACASLEPSVAALLDGVAVQP